MFRLTRLFVRPALALAIPMLLSGLAACGPANTEGIPDQVTRNARERGQGLSRQTGGGTLFGPGGLFGSREEKRQGLDEPGVAVNAYLWRASLDVIVDNKWPVGSADPFGGLIITDWFSFAESPNERLKLQILILGRDLRADALRVSVIRQAQAGARGWVEAPVDPKTPTEIENAILTRARQLRIATGG